MGCCASSEDHAKLSFNESRSKLLSANAMGTSQSSVSVGCTNPLNRSKITDFHDGGEFTKHITIKPTPNAQGGLGLPSVKIEVNRNTCGLEIKQQIFTEFGIPVEQQELKFAGKEFGDDNTVHQCGSMPVEHTTLHLNVLAADSARGSNATSGSDDMMYRSSGSHPGGAGGYSYHGRQGPPGTGYSTEDESVPKSWTLDSTLERRRGGSSYGGN